MHAMSLLWTAALWLLLVGTTQAFLATPLNYTDPDVANVLCPDQMSEPTRDHKWITREGIRRRIRQFFLDYPPANNPSFNIPTDASLTELYHAYYGEAASATRFIKAVNTIAKANINADSSDTYRFDKDIQGDAESFPGMQDKLEQRYPQMLTAITMNDAFPAARELLGLSLHTIQKFYAHSTWIELGNTGILENLGLPGFSFNDAAEPAEDVCTACPSANGECQNNVISGAGLSSGYYVYSAGPNTGNLTPKPNTGGKCSHGGVLDQTKDEPAEGGINKDTSSPCFSPHHYLHQQAAELAVQATDHYLTVILDAVEEMKFRHLFDLYNSSALSITIDTTGSMSGEIDSVKWQVGQIVANSAPEVYVLAPFNDDETGPITKTTDSDEFMDAVDALYVYSGSGPEMFWTGLSDALANTPDYSDIFSFTDNGGSDGDLMESMIALAVQKHCKVTIIYSGSLKQGYISDIEDYHRLVDSTGGLFIPSGKFDVNDITAIMGEGVQSSVVDITILKELNGKTDVEIPIDNSIFDFEVRIAGEVSSAIFTDITGTEYDLMDSTNLNSTAGVEVIVHTPSLKAIRWNKPRYGSWHLQTDSSSTYSLAVNANSTLSWLGDFNILDPSPPHPHYRPVVGNPITNTYYYLEISLVGYLESKVVDVNKIQYVDRTGALIREIEYSGDIDDTFYIRVEPLPETQFYIKIWGHVQSGNEFSRLMSVLISPVETSVDVIATSVDICGLPGETKYGDFLISNYGLSADFDISGTDSLGFLTDINPEKVYIENNNTAVVTATFYYPPDATERDVSTVTITAKSRLQSTSVNSATTYACVLSKITDLDPPICVSIDATNCTGYTINAVCNDKNWTTTAVLQDKETGLFGVSANPSTGITSIVGLTPGTTDEVTVTYESTCCTTQVDIIGTDLQGNVGKCIVDMGVLGGLIYDLEAESEGLTWVNLKWKITPYNVELHLYSLMINNDLSLQFKCSELSCTYNVTMLDPCSHQEFELTPHFYVNGDDRAGAAAFTDDYTLDLEPTSPTNGVQVDEGNTTVIISWDAPASAKCIFKYEVCYEPIDYDESNGLCEQTASTEYTMQGLEPCLEYEVQVTSLSPSGLASPPLVFNVHTTDAMPGEPTNVTVQEVTEESMFVWWQDPIQRKQCVLGYQVGHFPILSMRKPSVDGWYHEEIFDLDPCTNYSVTVSALSKTGIIGPSTMVQTRTGESAPQPVIDASVDGMEVDRLHVSWLPTGHCNGNFRVCYHDTLNSDELCQDVENTDITLTGLNPCMYYTIYVSSVSPGGLVGNRTRVEGSTLDVVPGEPENVRITSITEECMSYAYDAPASNPQCSIEHEVNVVNLDAPHRAEVHTSGPFASGTECSLDGCTNYMFKVRSVSPSSGFTSNWVSTTNKTDIAIPGQVRNLQTVLATQDTIIISWFIPTQNSRCVVTYTVSWIDDDGMTDSMLIPLPGPNDDQNEITAELLGLESCAHYAITVIARNDNGDASKAVSIDANTVC